MKKTLFKAVFLSSLLSANASFSATHADYFLNKLQIRIDDQCLGLYKSSGINYAYKQSCTAAPQWSYTDFGQLITKTELGYQCLQAPNPNTPNEFYVKLDHCDISDARQSWILDPSESTPKIRTAAQASPTSNTALVSYNYYFGIYQNVTNYPIAQPREIEFIMQKKSPGYVQLSIPIKPINNSAYELYAKNNSYTAFTTSSNLQNYKNYYNLHENTLFSNWGDGTKYKKCYSNKLTNDSSYQQLEVTDCPEDKSSTNDIKWYFYTNQYGSVSIKSVKNEATIDYDSSYAAYVVGKYNTSLFQNSGAEFRYINSTPLNQISPFYSPTLSDQSLDQANSYAIAELKRYFLSKTINCNAKCYLEQIAAQLEGNDYARYWSIGAADSVEVLSSLSSSGNTTTSIKNKNLGFANTTTDLIKTGKNIIDINTFERIDDGVWDVKISNALLEIENRARQNGTNPIVRINIGLGGLATGWPSRFIEGVKRNLRIETGFDAGIPEYLWNDHLLKTLNKLTAPLKGNTNMEIYIGGGRRVVPSAYNLLTWNHSKVVAVDGEAAIIGGQNLWNDYFSETPVLDTNVKISGNLGYLTQIANDELWRNTPSDHILRWSKASVSSSNTIPRASDKLPIAKSTPQTANGTPTLIISQGFELPNYGGRDDSLKISIESMLQLAKSSISISQQDLLSPYYDYSGAYSIIEGIDTKLSNILVKKAISGVNVKVFLSNTNAPHNTTARLPNIDVLRIMWKQAINDKIVLAGATADVDGFCNYFRIGNIRIDNTSNTYAGQSTSFANHSKTIMVDDKVFLIGSHNIYAQAPAHLQEVSYIFANENEAKKFKDAYWTPLESFSSRTFVDKNSCRSALVAIN